MDGREPSETRFRSYATVVPMRELAYNSRCLSSLVGLAGRRLRRRGSLTPPHEKSFDTDLPVAFIPTPALPRFADDGVRSEDRRAAVAIPVPVVPSHRTIESSSPNNLQVGESREPY